MLGPQHADIPQLVRHLAQNVISHPVDILISVEATGLGSSGDLHGQQVVPKVLGSIGEVGDLGIRVQSKDNWGVDKGNLVDSVDEALQVHLVGSWLSVVEVRGLAEEELAVLVEEEVAHILFQVGHQDTTIPAVCDSTTIHGFSNEVLQGRPWNLFFLILPRLSQVHVQQAERYSEVAMVEVVCDVPSDLAVFSAILDDGVEEADNVDQWLEGGMRAFIELLFRDL